MTGKPVSVNAPGAAEVNELDKNYLKLDRLKGLTKQPHWTFTQIGYAEVYTILGSECESKARYQAIIDSTNRPVDMLQLA
jgi:hypothetical protein